MQKLEIMSGDFLKNAGIVGMRYILDSAGACKGKDYDITEDEQILWLEKNFALNTDWTDLYFKTFVKYLGPTTVYQSVLDKIEYNLIKMQEDVWQPSKETKDDLKFINDKLLSNSYKSGFENIKHCIKEPQIYERLKKEKLNTRMETLQLQERLEELKRFLLQPLCKETFSMKSIIYNYINRFWDGKSFLLKTNAKKDMREMFENDFINPFRFYLSSEHKKAKDLCIDCGMPMTSKERVSIAFMKDMADDLSRKKSAFWNCKVDAYLCPVCAFLYSISPLGFQLIGDKFIFINTNNNIQVLWDGNEKTNIINRDSRKKDNEKYSAWNARAMNLVLKEKTKELINLQIILRGTDENDHYLFQVIYKEILNILRDKKIKEYMQKISEHPVVKIKKDYLNIYEKVVWNIIQYRQQYFLLNLLLRETIENDGIIGSAYFVYMIQLRTEKIIAEKKGMKFMSRFEMRDSGYQLRKVLLASKGETTDESLRGVIYRLLNALSVKDEGKFMDIIVRIYCSSKLLIPDGFVQMLGNEELFQRYGYAFVLGLKGSHPDNKKEKEEKNNE